MNVEGNRLQTFHTWPGNAPVDPIHLAREGFFATGNFLEAECNWCHESINDWHYGDNIRTRHTQLDPLCVFITNPANSGNVPDVGARNDTEEHRQQLSAEPTTSSAEHAAPPLDITQLDLKVEANRLATFVNWPNPNITPQALAKAGFYYFNNSDQVRCAWCKGIIAMWEKQDNAFEEHQRFFPDCPRVQLGPLIEIASDGIRDLGIQQISPPKRPKFSSLDARLRTYTNWPISDIQRPEALAQAGLYYHDVDDQVRCFHCYIGLRSWEKHDDPWFEHAKWYPQCQFVRLVKGHNYVQQVQDMTRNSTQQLNFCEEVTSEIQPTVSIEDAMCTQPVLQALEIGIDVGSIRTATQRRLQLTRQPYDTVENLLKAVFGDPDDSDYDDIVQNHGDASEGAFAAILREASRSNSSLEGTDDNSENNAPTMSAATMVSHVVATQPNCVSPNIASTQCNDVPTRRPSHDIASGIQENTQNYCPAAESTTVFTDQLKKACESQSIPDRNISLEEENRKLKDARLCKVCLDEEVGVVFLPCGHLVTCVQCAPGVNQCPMCRTAIKGFVRTFLS